MKGFFVLKTNADKLVQMSVQGQVQHPEVVTVYRVDRDGKAHILPATGGIVYNVQVGDLAMGWVSDHTEPGVTIKHDKRSCNLALNTYSCIGNIATVVSGDAKGAKGYVTGTHGGVEHVMVYLAQEDLEKLTVEDKIAIKAWGQGLELTDHPSVSLLNIDPKLFARLPIEVKKGGKLQVSVAGIVPPYLMGSGLGAPTAGRGDYDIMTTDMREIRKNKLQRLRLGDLVLLQDCDNRFGRAYNKGSVSIGVVIHGDSVKMGHGPGVTSIMTCPKGSIEGVLDKNSNIAKFMEI